MAFAFASGCRGKNRRVAHLRAIIRRTLLVPRAPLTCLLAALFLFSTFEAARPLQLRPPANAEFSETLAALGEGSEAALLSICYHGGDEASGQPHQNQTLPCKNCPFCIAFHHLPPVPHRGFDCAVYASPGSTTFVLNCFEPARVREMADQSRPRAPPLV